MTLLASSPALLAALRGEMTPKFLASRDSAGKPNVVPVISILPSDDEPDTLFFGNFLLRKTVRNLDEDRRVAVLVITTALEGWVLKGEFVEWQRTGPYVERQMSSGLLRYNAYTGVRNAGILRVTAVDRSFRIGKLEVLRDYLLARVAAGRSPGDAAGAGAVVPLPVRNEFARMQAVKVLAWIGQDGSPTAAPALSLQPAGDGVFVCRQAAAVPAPPPGALAAANILTFDAVSYQAKGRWGSSGHTGSLFVQEVYAGGPPIPGGRIA